MTRAEIEDGLAVMNLPPDDAGALAVELRRERARREARRILDLEARGPIDIPALPALSQFLAEPDHAPVYRIEGWLPAGGRVVLSAARKAGKTTLIGGVLRSFADGDPFLGSAPVIPSAGATAHLDLELGRSTLRRWLRDQRIRHTERVFVEALRGRAHLLNVLDPACRAQWVDWLSSRNVKRLVIDCMRPALDALGLDENRDAGRWLVGLDALQSEAAIDEVVVVHHHGHNSMGGERSRGDSRIRDWPDVEWTLVRQDDNDDRSPRYLRAYGRDVDQPEQQLAYDPRTRRLTIAGGSRADVRLDTALEAVLEVLEAGTMSGRAIKAALNDTDHSRDRIDAALRYGVQTGRLTVTEGPRRSHIYASSERVSGSVRQVSAVHPSECPVPYIEPDTRTLSSGGSVSGLEAPNEF